MVVGGARGSAEALGVGRSSTRSGSGWVGSGGGEEGPCLLGEDWEAFQEWEEPKRPGRWW